MPNDEPFSIANDLRRSLLQTPIGKIFKHKKFSALHVGRSRGRSDVEILSQSARSHEVGYGREPENADSRSERTLHTLS